MMVSWLMIYDGRVFEMHLGSMSVEGGGFGSIYGLH